jgi:hypothetical protein
MKCKHCGCTDAQACPGGCWWVSPEVCSSCEGKIKERPILFSAPMVRALLDGTKTQTRRLLKHPFISDVWAIKPAAEQRFAAHTHDWWLPGATAPMGAIKCPYGQAGDRLWVRETTIRVEEHGYKGPVYVASDEGCGVLDWGLRPAPDDTCDVEPENIRCRPAIHMPRVMSRILLEITTVRVERLQDISERDALAEGVEPNWVGPLDKGPNGTGTEGWLGDSWIRYGAGEDGEPAYSARESFQSLWTDINGPGAWITNPGVWVVEFKRVNA